MATLDSDDLEAIAARLLASPANKLATDVTGKVSISGVNVVGGAVHADLRYWVGVEAAVPNTVGGPWWPLISADTTDAEIVEGATVIAQTTEIVLSGPVVGDVVRFHDTGDVYKIVTVTGGDSVTVAPAIRSTIPLGTEFYHFHPQSVATDAKLPSKAHLAGSDAADGAVASAVVTALGGSTVTYTGPVADNGDVTLYAGADYSGGQSLVWTITGWSGASVNGEAVTLALMRDAKYSKTGGAPDLEITTGTASQASTTVTVTVPVTAAQTAALLTSPPLDEDHYQLQVRSNTTKQMLVDAECTVRKNALSS
jgi:hypothetical protein